MGKTGRNIVTILDIGTAKIACFIARTKPGGQMEIIGIGHQLSKGFKGGVITDINLAQSAILAAVDAAEKMANEHVEAVIVNVSGAHLSSYHSDITLALHGNEISDREINRAIAQGFEECTQKGLEVLHVIPTDYGIDNSYGIANPRGLFGKHFHISLHLVATNPTIIQNFSQCLARCHLNIEDIVATPYASALACTNESEKELGAYIIDIGGSNTSVALFKENHLHFIDAIPIGGLHITSDIAQGLSIDLSSAERMKTLYGNVIKTEVDKKELVDIPAANHDMNDEDEDPRQIQRSFLTDIIRPRVEEILEMVKHHIDQSPYGNTSIQRIILTGGTSQLMGIKELAAHMFKKQVRIGQPSSFEGLAESTKGPAFSTAVGMLHYAENKRENDRLASQEKMRGLRHIFMFFKSLLNKHSK